MTDYTDNTPELVTCDRCGGSGEGPADGSRCRTCKGLGSVLKPAASVEPDDDGDAKYDQWNEEERDR